MKEMKRKIFPFLALLLYASPIFSQALSSEPVYSFVVWLHDGGRVSFPLEEHPVVTHRDGMLVVSSNDAVVEYAHSAVHKFTLTDEEIPAGIATTELGTRWEQRGETMVFADCTPSERLSIFDASGRLVKQYAIAPDGTLEIPLGLFAEGMYVVKIESLTYKFMKR